MQMDGTMFWDFLRVIVVLAVVVPAAIFATKWYGKKQVPGKDLRIKGALSLGSNKAVYVIEWQGKHLLLGVTNHSITVLDAKDHREEDFN